MISRVAQPFSHTRLAQALETGKPEEIILCHNTPCRFSRRERVRTDTLRDVRIGERQEQEEAARKLAEAQTKAAEDKAREAPLKPLREDWHQYKISQISAGTPLAEIVNFERWLKLGDSTRDKIMSAIAKHTGVRIAVTCSPKISPCEM